MAKKTKQRIAPPEKAVVRRLSLDSLPVEIGAVCLITVLAGVLLLANLDDQLLWQDEAQTALIAKTVLTRGLPYGYDGKNFFSQELGLEYSKESGYLYRWHTWFPFYLVAGFFGALGASTWTARLPFALLGLAAIPLGYLFARSLWGSRRAALLAVLLLATSVPFLLLSRQCRYYSPCAFFSLLGLLAYLHLLQRRRWAGVLFVVAAILLFQCQVPYWGMLLATVVIHAAMFHRDRLISVALWSFVTFVLNLPWLIWLLSPPAVGRYPHAVYSVAGSFHSAAQYLIASFHYLFSPVLLFLLAITSFVAARRQGGLPKMDRTTTEGTILLTIFVAINIVGLSILSPYYFFRYLAPTIPVLCILAGRILDASMRLHPTLGIAGLAAILWFSPIGNYLDEITHHYRGPTEGIVAYLNAHGSPEDVVAITYGDLPLKFYTPMRVVGGLTGEDLSPALKAKWVIIRHNVICEKDFAVRQYLATHLRSQDYRPIELPYPDIPFDNRESPDEHLYRTVTNAPGVVIFERIVP